jgi:alpha-methylacyl-CoA racemase
MTSPVDYKPTPQQRQTATAQEPTRPDSYAGLPLSGIRVLDLSTLLPGPMASLLLAESGAEVIKIERSGVGDEMRSYTPTFGEASANYALLNRGKRAFGADLKNAGSREQVLDLMRDSDIVIEQFRPGVIDRLGLGYDVARELNPGVIYCSITGYGPGGPLASRAGHDLNYVAESGLLGLTGDASGNPALPFTVLADIAGGTYPAVMNILLALRTRDATGQGCHLQVSMAHNLRTLAYGYLATRRAGGNWPIPGRELLTGGSPRYNIYRTADDRHLAVAALEDRFWIRFTELIGLAPSEVQDAGREDEVMETIAQVLSQETSEHWRGVLDGEDVCVSVVNTMAEAEEMGLLDTVSTSRVSFGERDIAALPVPLDPAVTVPPEGRPYPRLEGLSADVQWAPRENRRVQE